jgi:hypothetical protein
MSHGRSDLGGKSSINLIPEAGCSKAPLILTALFTPAARTHRIVDGLRQPVCQDLDELQNLDHRSGHVRAYVHLSHNTGSAPVIDRVAPAKD